MSLTKCIVIGEEPKEAKKPIGIVYVLTSYLEVKNCNATLKVFSCIELICKNYGKGFDLMFGYKNPNNRSEGSLFLGHWNDGVA